MAVKHPLAETLDTIADRAPSLRAAGVLRVAVDGVAFTLAPPGPPAPGKEATTPPSVEAELGSLRAFRGEDVS